VNKALRFLVPVAAATIAMSACGNTNTPTPKQAVPSTVASKPGAAATKVASPAAAAKATAPTPVTTTGDADLDKADAELKAFENESAGLDQAVTATQETKS
jgi:hypothetical protein